MTNGWTHLDRRSVHLKQHDAMFNGGPGPIPGEFSTELAGLWIADVDAPQKPETRNIANDVRKFVFSGFVKPLLDVSFSNRFCNQMFFFDGHRDLPERRHMTRGEPRGSL